MKHHPTRELQLPERPPELEEGEYNKIMDDMKKGLGVIEEKMRSWLGEYQKLPLLVFTLGGNNGHIFLLAFLKFNQIVLKSIDQWLISRMLIIAQNINENWKFQTYISFLENSVERDDFGLLNKLHDANFLKDALGYVEDGNMKAHQNVYTFCVENIYFNPIHTMGVEGGFNLCDIYCNTKMSINQTAATLLAREMKKHHIEINPDDFRAAKKDRLEQDYHDCSLEEFESNFMMLLTLRSIQSQLCSRSYKFKYPKRNNEKHIKLPHQYQCNRSGCKAAFLNRSQQKKHFTEHRRSVF